MPLTDHIRVLDDIANERDAQLTKWGPQSHWDGTGDNFKFLADDARYITDQAAKAGELTWQHILTEEYYEALSEQDAGKLRTELVQVAAVCAAWIQDIDTR